MTNEIGENKVLLFQNGRSPESLAKRHPTTAPFVAFGKLYNFNVPQELWQEIYEATSLRFAIHTPTRPFVNHTDIKPDFVLEVIQMKMMGMGKNQIYDQLTKEDRLPPKIQKQHMPKVTRIGLWAIHAVLDKSEYDSLSAIAKVLSGKEDIMDQGHLDLEATRSVFGISRLRTYLKMQPKLATQFKPVLKIIDCLSKGSSLKEAADELDLAVDSPEFSNFIRNFIEGKKTNNFSFYSLVREAHIREFVSPDYVSTPKFDQKIAMILQGVLRFSEDEWSKLVELETSMDPFVDYHLGEVGSVLKSARRFALLAALVSSEKNVESLNLDYPRGYSLEAVLNKPKNKGAVRKNYYETIADYYLFYFDNYGALLPGVRALLALGRNSQSSASLNGWLKRNADLLGIAKDSRHPESEHEFLIGLMSATGLKKDEVDHALGAGIKLVLNTRLYSHSLKLVDYGHSLVLNPRLYINAMANAQGRFLNQSILLVNRLKRDQNDFNRQYSDLNSK